MAGELLRVPVARAGITMKQSKARIAYMTLPMFRWEPCLTVFLLGGGTSTEEDSLGPSLFDEGIPAAGLGLVFDLTLLAGLSFTTILALFCPAGLVCEAAPLTDLAL